jgi:hypothetical protein
MSSLRHCWTTCNRKRKLFGNSPRPSGTTEPRIVALDLAVACGNGFRPAGEPAIDAAKNGILFVEDGRHIGCAGRKQGRKRGIAAEADDDIGAMFSIQGARLAAAFQHRSHCLEQADRPAAKPARGQDVDRDVLEQAGIFGAAIVGHKHHAVAPGLQLSRKGMCGDHVPASATGGEYDVHRAELSPPHLTT